MSFRFALAGLVVLTTPHCLLQAQGLPTGVIGWYNGDWKPLIPSWNNFYVSDQQTSRVYDDFVVPDSGWTVSGVFAHIDMPSLPVASAFWEIRSAMSVGSGGTVIASGINPATTTQTGTVGDGTNVYLLVVNGLSVQLPPGQYWLNVAPVVPNSSKVYLCATLGTNAIGTPAGNDGGALYSRTPSVSSSFAAATASGSGGTSSDVSLGVLISPTEVLSRGIAWGRDLLSLTQQMPTLHSLPLPGIDLQNFYLRAALLAMRAPSISDAEVRTGVQQIVASIGDPHTNVEWPSPSPFQYLPLSFYWFDDGIYVTGAPAAYRNLLGGKLVTIGQSSVDDAVQKLTPLVAHDNDSWLKYVLMSSTLTNTDFLFGTGVTGANDSVQIQVQQESTGLATAQVQAVAPGQFPTLIPVYQGNLPLYRQHPEKHYWATVIDGGATVYFQYNSCTEDPNQSSADFFVQLAAMMAQSGVQRLVIDMRNNTGGSAQILDPWIAQLEASPFNRAGRLYVIVGRATFSAAMEASNLLQDNTNALFVGEPTGGKPQFLLRKGDFGLPFYGLRVSYSSGNEGAKDPGPALVPDIVTGLSFQDYMNGADPALDAILKTPAPGAM